MVRFMVLFECMPQVSKRFIGKKTQDHIIKLFISGIALTKTENDAVSFLEDILTPTEKLMLSKRFSIAFMLMHGTNWKETKKALWQHRQSRQKPF